MSIFSQYFEVLSLANKMAHNLKYKIIAIKRIAFGPLLL